MSIGKLKDWESLCHCCGLCCYEKVRQSDGSWVLDRSKPCPWLDESTMLCKVYEKRLKVYPRCRKVRLHHALFAPYLPSSCGYVRELRPGFLPASRLVIAEEIVPDSDSETGDPSQADATFDDSAENEAAEG